MITVTRLIRNRENEGECMFFEEIVHPKLVEVCKGFLEEVVEVKDHYSASFLISSPHGNEETLIEVDFLGTRSFVEAFKEQAAEFSKECYVENIVHQNPNASGGEIVALVKGAIYLEEAITTLCQTMLREYESLSLVGDETVYSFVITTEGERLLIAEDSESFVVLRPKKELGVFYTIFSQEDPEAILLQIKRECRNLRAVNKLRTMAEYHEEFYKLGEASWHETYKEDEWFAEVIYPIEQKRSLLAIEHSHRLVVVEK